MTIEAILEQALQLPPEEREWLCERIWDSLNDEDVISLTPEQEQELKRRIADHEAHPEEVIPWEKVKAKLFEISDGRHD